LADFFPHLGMGTDSISAGGVGLGPVQKWKSASLARTIRSQSPSQELLFLNAPEALPFMSRSAIIRSCAGATGCREESSLSRNTLVRTQESTTGIRTTTSPRLSRFRSSVSIRKSLSAQCPCFAFNVGRDSNSVQSCLGFFRRCGLGFCAGFAGKRRGTGLL